MKKNIVVPFKVDKSMQMLLKNNAALENIPISPFIRTTILTYINIKAQRPDIIEKYRIPG